MFEILGKIKTLRTHLANGDYLAAARLMHEILGVFLQPQTMQAAGQAADIDAIQAEWEGCEEDIAAAKPPTVGGAAPVGIDPATLLLLIQTFGPLVAKLIKRLRDRNA